MHEFVMIFKVCHSIIRILFVAHILQHGASSIWSLRAMYVVPVTHLHKTEHKDYYSQCLTETTNQNTSASCWITNVLRHKHTAVSFIRVVSTVVDSITSFSWKKTSSISTAFSDSCTGWCNNVHIHTHEHDYFHVINTNINSFCDIFN